MTTNTPLLRLALIADAVASGATGLLSIVAADWLAGFLNLPRDLLFYAGLALMPFVALLVWTATRPAVPRGAVMAIVDINLLWAIASFALLIGGWIAPNTLGVVFVAGQALVVAALGVTQVIALRHNPAQTSP